MDHAVEEKVPVTLVAIRVGRPLYESVGFPSYGTWTWATGQGTECQLMRWDPPPPPPPPPVLMPGLLYPKWSQNIQVNKVFKEYGRFLG